jgi:hypothetical protein
MNKLSNEGLGNDRKVLKYDNHTYNNKKDYEMARKKDVVFWYWFVFFIFLILAIVSVVFKQTLSFVIFAIICFLMAILSWKIINVIWSGVK